MEEDIQNYSPAVMFRGTTCIFLKNCLTKATNSNYLMLFLDEQNFILVKISEHSAIFQAFFSRSFVILNAEKTP